MEEKGVGIQQQMETGDELREVGNDRLPDCGDAAANAEGLCQLCKGVAEVRRDGVGLEQAHHAPINGGCGEA